MQDNATADIFGVPAIVEKQMGKLVTLQVKQVQMVAGVEIAVPSKRVECEEQDVVLIREEDMDPKQLKRLGSLTIGETRHILKACCGNETCWELGGNPGHMLSDADIMCIEELLQWQYQAPEVCMVKPSIVKIVIHFGLEQEAGRLCLMELKELVKVKKFLILPVHCDAPMHWTFLELEMEEAVDNIVAVRYWDWCRNMETSAALAQKLLSYLCFHGAEEWIPLKLPVKTNAFVQKPASNDCGFAGWQIR